MVHFSKEILLSLRGRQSAQKFSAKLGYKSNQFHRWESGHSRFYWSDFLDLCKRLNVSEELLKSYEFQYKPDDLMRLLKFLFPNRTSSQIAKICKVSPLTLKRWSATKSSPTVDKIFDLFTVSGTPLAPLLSLIFGARKITPPLQEFLNKEAHGAAVMMKNPWTIAIACRCLQVDLKGISFVRALKIISIDLQVEHSIVSDTVHRLVHARLLIFSEDNGFSFPKKSAHYEFRNDFFSFIEGAKFWIENSKLMLDRQVVHKPGENHFSYLVFSLRSEDVKRIHEKLIDLYKDLAAMSQENEGSGQCDRTFSFIMNLNRLDGCDFGKAVTRRSHSS